MNSLSLELKLNIIAVDYCVLNTTSLNMMLKQHDTLSLLQEHKVQYGPHRVKYHILSIISLFNSSRAYTHHNKSPTYLLSLCSSSIHYLGLDS